MIIGKCHWKEKSKGCQRKKPKKISNILIHLIYSHKIKAIF